MSVRECAHKGQGEAPVQLLRMQAKGDTGEDAQGARGSVPCQKVGWVGHTSIIVRVRRGLNSVHHVLFWTHTQMFDICKVVVHQNNMCITFVVYSKVTIIIFETK
jgi:hypothetical protein